MSIERAALDDPERGNQSTRDRLGVSPGLVNSRRIRSPEASCPQVAGDLQGHSFRAGSRSACGKWRRTSLRLLTCHRGYPIEIAVGVLEARAVEVRAGSDEHVCRRR